MWRGSIWESGGVMLTCIVFFLFLPNGQATNRKLDVAFVADPAGNPLSRPSQVPAKVGSPASLVRPDRYEFYTFDETGELIKRLMTLEEIQEIIATGDGDDGHMLTIAHTDLSKPPVTFNFQPPTHVKVHTIVSNVQNVLKAEMEAQKTNPAKPSLFDTPDVSSSWSMILPAIFGNTGGSITPDNVLSSHSGPETDVISLVDDNDKSEEYPEEVIDLDEKNYSNNKTQNLQTLNNNEKVSTEKTTTIGNKISNVDIDGDIFNFASKTTEDDLSSNIAIPSSPATFSSNKSANQVPKLPQKAPTKSSQPSSSTTQAAITSIKTEKSTFLPETSTARVVSTSASIKEALVTSTTEVFDLTTKVTISSTIRPTQESVTQKTTSTKTTTNNTVKSQPSTTTVKTVPSTQKVNLVKISSSSSSPTNLSFTQSNTSINAITKKPSHSQNTSVKNKPKPTTSGLEITPVKNVVSSTTQKPQVLTTSKPVQHIENKIEEPLIDIGQIMNQIANNLGSSESSVIRNNNTIQENKQTTQINKKIIRSTVAPPLGYLSTDKSITQEHIKSTAVPTSYIDPTALKVTQNVKDLQTSTLEATATTMKNTSPDIKAEISTIKYQTVVNNAKISASETTEKPVHITKIESTTVHSNMVTKSNSQTTLNIKNGYKNNTSIESQDKYLVTKPALYELSDSITDLISQISDNTHPPMVPLSDANESTNLNISHQNVEQTTNAINVKVQDIANKIEITTESNLENQKKIEQNLGSKKKEVTASAAIEENKEDVAPTTYRPTTNSNTQTSTLKIENKYTETKGTTQSPSSTTKQYLSTKNSFVSEIKPTTKSKESTTSKDDKLEAVTESDTPLKISLNTERYDELDEDESTESYDYDSTTENGVTEDDEMMQMLNQVSEIFKMSSSAQLKSEEMDTLNESSPSNKTTSYKKTDLLADQGALVIDHPDSSTIASNKNKRKPQDTSKSENKTSEKLTPVIDQAIPVKSDKPETMIINKLKEVLKTTTSKTLENKEKEVVNNQFTQSLNTQKFKNSVNESFQKNMDKNQSSENLKDHINNNNSSSAQILTPQKEIMIPINENQKDNKNTMIIQNSTKKLQVKETIDSINDNENSEISSSTLRSPVQEVNLTPKEKTDKLKNNVTTDITKQSSTASGFIKIDNIQTPMGIVTEKSKESNKLTTEKVIPQTSSTMRSVDTNIKVIMENNLTTDNETSWKLVPTVVPQNETSKSNVTNIKLAGLSSFQPLPYQRPYFNEDSIDKIKKPETHSISENIDLQGNHESHGLERTTASLSEDVYQFAEFCNELGFRYWNAVSANGIDQKRSLVVSNFAITSMLALVFLGAKGATSDEMNEILKLDDMMTFNPHIVFKNVTESIEVSKKSGVATSAFIRELYSDREKGRLLSFYKDRAQQFYSAHVEEVNFKVIGDIIRRRTNLLVKRQTWGKIPEYLKTNNMNLKAPLAAFAANIFQTDCSGASTDGRDGEMYFVVSPTIRQRRLIPVPAVLYKNGFLAGYVPELDATVAAIGGAEQVVSTILLMPGQQGSTAQGDDIMDLQKRLIESVVKDETWTKLLRSLVPRQGLELQIPRFSHRSIVNATSALQLMGLKDLFSDGRADLRGLNGQSNDLYLSDMMAVNTFTICGEGFIGEQHHVESYPGEPNKVQRRLWRTPNRPLVLETPLVQGTGDLWEEPRDYQRAFHDPLHDTSYLSMPLHLRPRQARLPEAVQDPPRLKFDKPFMFFVRHNPTGLILHMGRYNPRLMP